MQIIRGSFKDPGSESELRELAWDNWSSEVIQEAAIVDGFIGFARHVRYALAQLAAHRISSSEAHSLREELRSRFEAAKEDLLRLEIQRAGREEQELINRGLTNTTVLSTLRRSIESGIQRDLARLQFEYTIALEKIGFQQARRWESWLARALVRFVLFLDRPLRGSALQPALDSRNSK